jgi:hypothetical protein
MRFGCEDFEDWGDYRFNHSKVDPSPFIGRYRGVTFHTAYAIVATAPLPLIAWLRWKRLRRRRRTGTCLICGYDLRASPDRCPECGKVRRDSRQAAA